MPPRRCGNENAATADVTNPTARPGPSGTDRSCRWLNRCAAVTGAATTRMSPAARGATSPRARSLGKEELPIASTHGCGSHEPEHEQSRAAGQDDSGGDGERDLAAAPRADQPRGSCTDHHDDHAHQDETVRDATESGGRSPLPRLMSAATTTRGTPGPRRRQPEEDDSGEHAEDDPGMQMRGSLAWTLPASEPQLPCS